MIKETESLQDKLLESIDEDTNEIADEIVDDIVDNFSNSFREMDVLFFKYRKFIKEVNKSKNKDLKALSENSSAFIKTLTDSWENYKKALKNKFEKIRDVKSLEQKVSSLRLELIRNLILFSPDTAISHYYERTKELHSKIINKLPSTSANGAEIKNDLNNIKNSVKDLQLLLDKYFSLSEQKADVIIEKEKREDIKNNLKKRKGSITSLKHGISTLNKIAEFIKSGNYLKTDFLVKDFSSTLDKSFMSFLDQPDEPEKALQLTIAWQEMLKQQSKEGIEIEAQEGDSKSIVKYLTGNQTDILNMSGHANMKIREKIQNSSKTKNNAQPPVPGQAAPAPQKHDPKKLEEAIKYVQDAMVEMNKIYSFLKAGEFTNTNEKHDKTIELLKKALELLKNKNKKDKDKNKDQDKDENKNQKNNTDKQQNDKGQGSRDSKGKSNPLKLKPEEARDLLNQLNKDDEGKKGKKSKEKRSINTPRPW